MRLPHIARNRINGLVKKKAITFYLKRLPRSARNDTWKLGPLTFIKGAWPLFLVFFWFFSFVNRDAVSNSDYILTKVRLEYIQ